MRAILPKDLVHDTGLAVAAVTILVQLEHCEKGSLERPDAQRAAQSPGVNWNKDIARGISAISAWDSTGQVLHATACGSEATLADMKVRVEADDTGSGVVVLGTNTFQISSGIEVSGGATCSRMYNDADVTVECEVPLGSAVDLKPLSDPSDMIRGCSSSFEHANRMLRLSMFATSPVTTDDATGSHVERDSGVSGRQVDVCPPYTDRRKVGPDHKWHLAEQVTDTINCENLGECGVGKSGAISTTVSASIAPGFEIFAASLEMSVSWTSETTSTCTGGTKDRFCMWYWHQYQGYSVEEKRLRCGMVSNQRTYDLKAPMTGNNHGEF
ncbi:hypothetical protein BDP81DRAFT_403398 [Colletotrichum phormii]|uniref:Uncharacterized protein n=1 Tax=Colletotrichum phormii TaxID=359342 RepID=A0AAI9ZZW3_9PEZI|nr:uncharacterized protein BDP81DRAFT_403398 [Colletotrichum phormii]KAK1641296.1 hypothetical protein BDP81DRAFT_403398 [Colletotrichum phormii]